MTALQRLAVASPVSGETGRGTAALRVAAAASSGSVEVTQLCAMLECTLFHSLMASETPLDIRPSIAFWARHCSREVCKGVRDHFVRLAYHHLPGDRTQRMKMLLVAIQRHRRTTPVRDPFVAALTMASLFRNLPGKTELYRIINVAL